MLLIHLLLLMERAYSCSMFRKVTHSIWSPICQSWILNGTSVSRGFIVLHARCQEPILWCCSYHHALHEYFPEAFGCVGNRVLDWMEANDVPIASNWVYMTRFELNLKHQPSYHLFLPNVARLDSTFATVLWYATHCELLPFSDPTSHVCRDQRKNNFRPFCHGLYIISLYNTISVGNSLLQGRVMATRVDKFTEDRYYQRCPWVSFQIPECEILPVQIKGDLILIISLCLKMN